MLLKFTSQDMFNTALVDVATGKPAFHLSTNVVPGPSSGPVRRQTEIHDGGAIIGTIGWVGLVPHITLLDETVGGLVELFAANTIQIIPKEISIPTRFDTEYLWTATPDSIYLLDYDSDTRQAQLHPHAPALKDDCTRRSPGAAPRTSSSRSTPSASRRPVEILVSLLMLDILRRGRFGLPQVRVRPAVAPPGDVVPASAPVAIPSEAGCAYVSPALSLSLFGR
ncbi:hypothetical protein DFH09DRAFT_114056 [Mycena vulgaris]|nr:hypothetical protein DFH09DRAFT_114056 [Mycena vulgaris]